MTNHTRVWDSALARKRIAEVEPIPGALLQILRSLQQEFGYIDEAAVPMIARALNISRAEVHDTISFYDFHRQRPGHHVLKICRAEACQSMDCDKIISHIEKRLGVKLGETTSDGSITFEAVFCNGLCASPPSLLFDGKPFGRVTPEMTDCLIDRARESL